MVIVKRIILPYSNPKKYANIGPKNAYYIPNQQNFHQNFYEVFRFELAVVVKEIFHFSFNMSTFYALLLICNNLNKKLTG